MMFPRTVELRLKEASEDLHSLVAEIVHSFNDYKDALEHNGSGIYRDPSGLLSDLGNIITDLHVAMHGVLGVIEQR
jgi:hypothetical protein